MSRKYLKFPALSEKLGGRSRASIHRDMRDRGFPKPINLGANSVVWEEGLVDVWLEELAQIEYKPVSVAKGIKPVGRPRKLHPSGV
jgi:predicted DNA-binding transcriptional regulator AlpA